MIESYKDMESNEAIILQSLTQKNESASKSDQEKDSE